MYIVPKRALAAEVEYKLSRILEDKLQTGIKVTSLYGGNDYGPGELSLNDSSQPLVIISTQEKTDALIRMLGNDFLKRIKLVVIDEAHNIDLQGEIIEGSRELRLETLIIRLKLSLSDNTKFIGLSAVAEGIEKNLSEFISSKGIPVKSEFKSTRQTIGRLYYSPSGYYEQYSDVMDGKVVKLKNEETQQPYILGPIANCPFGDDYNRDKSHLAKMKQRLFWAAINFASQKNKGKNKTVLISILTKEKISITYAKDFWEFIENDLNGFDISQYFSLPIGENLNLYNQALEICEDYLGKASIEFKLLIKGIVLHHGKMPGKLGRILIQLIEKNVINIVLANTTLIEGVNLPFEIILLPYASLYESDYPHPTKLVNVKHLKNLMGRAGRPGLTTEGQTFVLLPNGIKGMTYYKTKDYFAILEQLFIKHEEHSCSAIDKLINLLYLKWLEITNEENIEKFIEWLENAKPLDAHNEALAILDDCDSFLLSIIEELQNSTLLSTSLEDILTNVWQSTYAYFIKNKNAPFLEKVIKTRGKSLFTTIYPNDIDRKFFYQSALTPKTAIQLNTEYPEIYNILLKGENYFSFSDNQKIQYILQIVDEFDGIEKLKIPESKIVRTKHLKWWLLPAENPPPGVPSNSYDFISKRFLYTFSRNLGSLISISLFGKEKIKGTQKEKTGLPWIVFWLKDLITWGTLDPVVAYLMANDNTILTRNAAKKIVENYYKNCNYTNGDEIYNPENIKDWLDRCQLAKRLAKTVDPTGLIEKRIVAKKEVNVKLFRDSVLYTKPYYRVIPIEKENQIYWFDLAGYPLAISDKGFVNIKVYDYILDSQNHTIIPNEYLNNINN